MKPILTLIAILLLKMSAFAQTNISNEEHKDSTKASMVSNQINQNDIRKHVLSVYPNPASNQINIKKPEGVKEATITVYNIIGKQLISESTNQNITTFSLDELPRGQYIIRLISGDLVLTKTFLKTSQ